MYFDLCNTKLQKGGKFIIINPVKLLPKKIYSVKKLTKSKYYFLYGTNIPTFALEFNVLY